MPAGYVPIVVDNGSTDGSGALAERLGAQVVREPVPGFGAACFAGLTAARDDLVCFMDCDASFDPGELPRVADPVGAGAQDLVLGRARALGPASRCTPAPRTGSSPSSCAGAPGCASPTSGRCGRRRARAARPRAARSPLRLAARDGPARRGGRLAVAEVPITCHPRAGASKVTGTVRGTARAVRDMAGALR
jgi:glycosyltransferase involved in cell wall biosynthesis